MTRTILAAAFAACAVLAAGTASAQTPTGPWRAIAYGDLDLSSASGAKTFQTRVDAAAQSFCADNRHLADRTTCERAIREEAVEQLPAAARLRYAEAQSPIVRADIADATPEA